MLEINLSNGVDVVNVSLDDFWKLRFKSWL